MPTPYRGPGQRSLKARALQWLAQREQSRQELRLKLLRAARSAADGADGADAADAADADVVDEATIDALLDTLEAAGHLSQQRFVESRIRSRGSRFGNRRIEAELRQHGLGANVVAIEALSGPEHQRAFTIWSRKFGPAPSADRGERARQARFLAARGFSADTVRAVVLGKAIDPDDA